MSAERRLWIALGALVVLTPVGFLAKGGGWAEWGLAELRDRVGFIPRGLARLSAYWPAAFVGYSLPGSQGTGFSALVCAAVGVCVILVLTWLAGRALVSGKERNGS